MTFNYHESYRHYKTSYGPNDKKQRLGLNMDHVGPKRQVVDVVVGLHLLDWCLVKVLNNRRMLLGVEHGGDVDGLTLTKNKTFHLR